MIPDPPHHDLMNLPAARMELEKLRATKVIDDSDVLFFTNKFAGVTSLSIQKAKEIEDGEGLQPFGSGITRQFFGKPLIYGIGNHFVDREAFFSHIVDHFPDVAEWLLFHPEWLG